MRLRKLKLKDGRVKVEAEEVSIDGNVRRISVDSAEQGRPELYKAVNALLGPALALIQAPDAWRHTAEVSGLSVNYEDADDRMGAVVTMLVDLPDTNSPLVVNTPHMREETASDSGGKFMPAGLLSAVVGAADEAMKYLDGKRAQGEMFEAAD